MDSKQLNNKQKKSQEQIWNEKLSSKDNETVKQTIKEIRELGNIKILPSLIEKFSNEADTEIKKELAKLLSDIKRKDAAEIFFQYVMDENYKHIKKELLSILWQSRLDYSPFINELINIFINEPFEIAFEAFTVIEYNDYPIDQHVAEQNIEKLKYSLRTIDEKKKFLLVDLVNLLKKWT